MTSKYEQLKTELKITENQLESHEGMSYKTYSYLMNKKAALQQEIDKLPLLYEIWYDDYDGSMRMNNSKVTLKYRYLNKDKAYKKLNKLNDDCNYGRPYFMRIEQLDG